MWQAEVCVCVHGRWGRCHSATSGESSTTYWIRAGRRTAGATPSHDILTACSVVHAATRLDRLSAASHVQLPVQLPLRASSTCPAHITLITGTQSSAAAATRRLAVIRRPPTRCSWTDILQVWGILTTAILCLTTTQQTSPRVPFQGATTWRI